MKLELDNLSLLEMKVLVDTLTAFRAGLPFSHPGRNPPAPNQPQLVKGEKE